MGIWGYFMGIFPFVHVTAILLNVVIGCQLPWAWAILPLSIYVLPVLVWRLQQRFYPLEFGVEVVRGFTNCRWWGSVQAQTLFNLFPFFERILLLIPGLYSAWLRSWGSTVGEHVFWAPKFTIIDRPFVRIGSRVVVGHGSTFTSHLVYASKEGEALIIVGPVEVGSFTIIAGQTILGPETNILEGGRLNVREVVLPNLKGRVRRNP